MKLFQRNEKNHTNILEVYTELVVSASTKRCLLPLMVSFVSSSKIIALIPSAWNRSPPIRTRIHGLGFQVGIRLPELGLGVEIGSGICNQIAEAICRDLGSFQKGLTEALWRRGRRWRWSWAALGHGVGCCWGSASAPFLRPRFVGCSPLLGSPTTPPPGTSPGIPLLLLADIDCLAFNLVTSMSSWVIDRLMLSSSSSKLLTCWIQLPFLVFCLR